MRCPCKGGRINSLLTRQLHEPPPGAFIQAAVGGKGDVLLLHRGIHHHPLEADRRDDPTCQAGLNRGRQEFLATRFAQALTPFHQGGRMAGKTVLEEGFSTEKLPVGRLQPVCHDRFVRDAVSVLQVQQPCHQTHRQCRWCSRFTEIRRHGFFQALPVDQRRQTTQFVIRIDQVHQSNLKQIVLGITCSGLGFHQSPFSATFERAPFETVQF